LARRDAVPIPAAPAPTERRTRRRPWTLALPAAALSLALSAPYPFLIAAPAHAAAPSLSPSFTSAGAHAFPPPAPPPASVTGHSAGFDPLHPSSDPLELRDAHRPLSVTYVHGGRVRTLRDYLARTGTQGFVVLDGRDVVHEHYFAANRDSLFQSWSMAKSFTPAAVSIAIGEGHVDSADDPDTR